MRLAQVAAAFIGSALLAGILSFNADAGAISRLAPASLCQRDTYSGENGGSFQQNSSATGLSYIANFASAGSATAYFACPFVDERANAYGLEHSEIQTVNVHGYDNSAGDYVRAQVCVQYYDDLGGTCDDYNASASTHFSINLTGTETSIWRDAAFSLDFPYVLVEIPASGGNLRAYGFWASDT